MNIGTGEIQQFTDWNALTCFFDSKEPQERENWVEVDPAKMTRKQLSKMIVSEYDHRSNLAIQRDILRKQRRSARRKSKK